MTQRGRQHELCLTQVDRLWHSIHRMPPPDAVRRVVELLVPPSIEASNWPSHVSDDHTPYELSLLLGGTEPEIRLMAEPLPSTRSVALADTVGAGLRLRDTLQSELGVDCSRLDRVADLFLPSEPSGEFALWFAACFAPDGRTSFKVYLNPAIRGRHAAPRLVEEALLRLGARGAWSTVTQALSRGPDLDELRFFSLDLGARETARAKVYGFHHAATIDDLVRAVAVVPGSQLDAVSRFCKTLLGGDGALLAPRQPATCLAFVGDDPRPTTGTVHIPIRAFAGDDGTAYTRVRDAMASAGVSSAPFEAAVSAMTSRPLDEGSGIVAWAAIRTGGGAIRTNVYLAPRAMGDGPTRPHVLPSERPDDPVSIVRRFDENSIAAHPFFARLAREPFDARPLALLVLNIRESTTRDFARRLASIVARVDEDAIRSVLAKQLNDELGDGDPRRTHKVLFERFAEGMAMKLPEAASPEQLRPGRTFGDLQEDLYTSRSAYEGVGATLVMELLGKQADLTLGTLLRRADEQRPEPEMDWLVLHEELEIAHAAESHDIARLIPPGTKARLAARGAEEIGRGGWKFLDEMYRVCFPA